MPPRTIIHLDLDAFFCSVEELQNPALHGKPFAVGGRPEERGVVASCSYPARAYGVRSAMPMGKALRLCPGLLVFPGRHRLYSEVSSQIMTVLREVSPLIEQVSIDEAYLEINTSQEGGPDIARKLQARIQNEFNLPCSLGVATNKLVAKIANDYGKASSQPGTPPRALTVVEPGMEARFLAPLPVIALLGVGPKTAQRLEDRGIKTIGDLANCSPEEMRRLLGKHGLDLQQHANGMDDSPIVTSHEIKSISQEVTFARDTSDEKILRQTISELADQVSKRLIKSKLASTTVKIKIRWPDFTTLTRQMSFPIPIQEKEQILETAISLFDNVWQPGKAVRLIGVGVANLHQPSGQLNLFDVDLSSGPKPPLSPDSKVQEVVDQLRQRFGEEVIIPASNLGKPKEKK